MITLEIIDHGRSTFHGVNMSFAKPSILMVRDGRENISGTHYVEVLFTKDVRDILPTDRNGLVAVKGQYNDVMKIINEGGADGK